MYDARNRPVRDSFTLLYADGIRTSQEAHLRASMACLKSYEEEEREVGSSERHYGWGGTEYIIGFEGSQAFPGNLQNR
jgi:hypothetical protein